jgi:hypothetical protein
MFVETQVGIDARTLKQSTSVGETLLIRVGINQC